MDKREKELLEQSLDFKINTKIMNILGFEEGYRRRLYDQDTMSLCKMGGKEIVSPGNMSGRNAIEFNPINNPKMMNFIFGLYLNKKIDDEEIPEVLTFYISKILDSNTNTIKNYLTIKFENGTEYKSKLYNNETTCFAETILYLDSDNSSDLENMSKYDFDRRKKPIIIKK